MRGLIFVVTILITKTSYCVDVEFFLECVVCAVFEKTPEMCVETFFCSKTTICFKLKEIDVIKLY